jgi:two-component system, NtrC family, sensor histidine kinase HydH
MEAASPPLDLVAGFDPSVNARALREVVIRVIATLLIAWAGIAALIRAWVRDIRARDLKAALDNERRERSRLAEMSLAAAGLAHETKNPLGLILGLAQRLNSDGTASPATKEAAEQIMDAADHATARLSDFINFARIATPHMQDVAAAQVLGRVVATMKPDFDEAGIRLELLADDLHIRCDSGMLEQVLVNLLLNSLQASAAGSTTTVRLSKQGTARASLSVTDQGRGIAAQLLPEIFKPYVTGRPDGHGLGLAIVKRLVEQQGWSISVDSTPGQGTTFTLTGLVSSQKGSRP